jgi:flagellar motor switch protein FliN/FliY
MSETKAGAVSEEKAANAAARPAEFPSLDQSTGQGGGNNPLDFILDIPLQLSVRIGSTRMVVRDLLQLGQGSVIELDKMAGEPMEVLVNGKLVARGEAVVVNEKLGVRLTDVISPMERVRHLQ